MRYPIEVHLSTLLKLFFVPDITHYYAPAYSWFVNQAGHALLGLALALGVVSGFQLLSPLSLFLSCLVTILIGLIGYALKELGDYNTITKKDAGITESLQLDRREILRDVLADWFFVNVGVVTGACIASAFFSFDAGKIYGWLSLAGFLSALAGFWGFGRYYLKTKLLWQYSNLPFLTDIAHCDSPWVNPLEEHLSIQVSAAPVSAVYVGSHEQVHHCLCGLARRRMVHPSNEFRRVRYWQVQELIDAFQQPSKTQSAYSAWQLAQADVHVVWLDCQNLPPLSKSALSKVSHAVWLIGAKSSKLPQGWSQLNVNTIVPLAKVS